MKQIILAETFNAGNSTNAIARWFDPIQVEFTAGQQTPIDDKLRGELAGRYGEIVAFCDTVDLPVSKKACLEVIRLLGSKDTSKGMWLHVPTTEVAKRLKDELDSKKCLLIRSDRQMYYDTELLFGEPVSNNFGSASFDISEAGKCFALGRFTASVLHLMRVLEIGLRVVAKSLRVRCNDEKSMQGLLNELKRKWNTIEGRKKKPKGWKSLRQFYNEAFVEFTHLKDAWRNYSAHALDSYDEDRAETILLHVQSFMRHLATKLED